ncbi:MAG: hypothetical protein V3U51_05355 [Thermoplasmata archaeon]
MSTRVMLKLVVLCLVVALTVLPLPILLAFEFTFFFGLVLLMVGAYVGILAFDTSLRISSARRAYRSRYWIVAPLTTVTFLLLFPPVEFWVASALFWEFWWFNLVMVIFFLSILPLVLGPLSYRKWRKENL